MNKVSFTTAETGTTDWLTLLAVQRQTTLSLDDHVFRMHGQDLILARQNERWQAVLGGPVSVVLYEQGFQDELMESQLIDCRIIYDFLHTDHPQDEHLYFRTRGTTEVEYFMRLLLKEVQTESMYQEKMIRLLTVGLLTCLDRTRDNTLIVPDSTMVSKNRFGRIMKYIGDHYTTVTLEETAQRFGYNPDYLSVRFKHITGVSFTEKVRSMRLDQAAHMLMTTEMTIEQIASAVGFHDKSWFMHCFKQSYGMTPAQYRRTNNQECRASAPIPK